MEKVVYTSLFFTTIGGAFRKSVIPVVAVSTYVKRDLALVKCSKLDGVSIMEYMKFRKVHMTASRKINRNGWNGVSV
jgi:hypothetical protein